MKNTTIITALFIFFTLFLQTELSSQQLNLTSQLQQIKNSYNVVGMSVCVVKQNSLVYSGNFGLRDINRNLPVNDSTIYRIASISKYFTAIALMKLYQQGLFNLDADVSTYLGYSLRNPYFPNDIITIRKILSHTASLRDGSGYNTFLNASYNQNPPPALQQLITPSGSYYTSDMFSSSKAPSDNYFTYANINYGIIGTLVEKISGLRFDIFCNNNIFQPLGLTASFVINDLPNINNVAVLYRKTGGNWVPQADNYNGVMPPPRNLTNYVIGSNAVIFSPQGGLRISAKDLSVIMRTMLNSGIFNGTRILNDTTVNLMHNPLWIFNGSNGNNYYGIFNTYCIGSHRTSDILQNEILYGHPGEAYGLISDLYFSKIKNYGIIFITNGGQWSSGNYSGWYNVEEDVFNACYNHLDSFLVNIKSAISVAHYFNLLQNFPNPFNSETFISFNIPDSKTLQTAELKIYDVSGKYISTLFSKSLAPGNYKIKFNASFLSSGIYFYKLSYGNYSKTKTMALLK